MSIIKLDFNGMVTEYETVEAAEKFLNEANYYCKELLLRADFEDPWTYNEKTDLEYIMEQAITYGNGKIEVYQIL